MTTNNSLYLGDCLEVLRNMPDDCIDAVVTDPPYGLSFMGKKWDYDVPSTEIWAECLRVLKPGGHLLAFAGTRTQHRMAIRIEDAGFEIRDMIAWVYGSGFPKSLDVSKAIDKAAGAERDVVHQGERSAARPLIEDQSGGKAYRLGGDASITAPATDAARQWQGWGTALKPALEPITVARKPLTGTVAENVMAHGTGALNIDGCRVGFESDADKAAAKPGGKATAKIGSLAGKAQDGFVIAGPVVDGERLYWSNETGWGSREGATVFHDEDAPDPVDATGREPATNRTEFVAVQGSGRWPANLIHDGSEEVLQAFPNAPGQQGDLKETGRPRPSSGRFGDMAPPRAHSARIETDSSAARFFYCAKASKKDRGEGNTHPTVKPTDLMRYLCRLVTPPGGVVLDPFMGSGSTGKAAVAEGFRFIGIEKDEHSFETAKQRVAY